MAQAGLLLSPRERQAVPAWGAIALAAFSTLAGVILVKSCSGWVEPPYVTKTELVVVREADAKEHTILKEADAKMVGAFGQVTEALNRLDAKIDERLPPKRKPK